MSPAVRAPGGRRVREAAAGLGPAVRKVLAQVSAVWCVDRIQTYLTIGDLEEQ